MTSKDNEHDVTTMTGGSARGEPPLVQTLEGPRLLRRASSSASRASSSSSWSGVAASTTAPGPVGEGLRSTQQQRQRQQPEGGGVATAAAKASEPWHAQAPHVSTAKPQGAFAQQHRRPGLQPRSADGAAADDDDAQGSAAQAAAAAAAAGVAAGASQASSKGVADKLRAFKSSFLRRVSGEHKKEGGVAGAASFSGGADAGAPSQRGGSGFFSGKFLRRSEDLPATSSAHPLDAGGAPPQGRADASVSAADAATAAAEELQRRRGSADDAHLATRGAGAGACLWTTRLALRREGAGDPPRGLRLSLRPHPPACRRGPSCARPAALHSGEPPAARAAAHCAAAARAGPRAPRRRRRARPVGRGQQPRPV